MAYNVSGLTDYVNISKEALIRDIVLGYAAGDTIANMAKRLGVKGSEILNYMDITATLQDGKGCGFNALGGVDFSEREVETKILKVNEQFCNDDLLEKWTEYQVRFGADANAQEFGFEKEIIDGIARDIDKQLEKIVWQGDTGLSITGLIGLAEGADSAYTVNVSVASGSSVYDAVQQTIMAIPEELLDEAFVALSPANFRKLVFEMIEKNNFHIAPEEIERGSFLFPGTTIPVRKTMGLAGVNDKIYSSVWKNLVYACDVLGDKNEFRTWFSDDDDVHKLKVKFNMGVTTYFPNAVVLAKIG